jgi:Domain of unknown function (DUF4942)
VTTEILKRDTVAQLIENFEAAVADITQAYNLLHAAKNRLNDSFGMGQRIYSFDVLPHGYHRGATLSNDSLDQVMVQIKLDAWRVIMERLELRKLLSIARREELDKQLSEGKGLPDITLENVWGMFESAIANVDRYMEEAVLEVFELLRPPKSKYKTNTEFEIGKRVILSWHVEPNFSRSGYKVRYSYDSQVTALDNAFLRLDGKGIVKTYNGPTHQAIELAGSDGLCETDYFKLRCCQNGNLHMEFKRPDLVKRLNAIAGGARLRK